MLNASVFPMSPPCSSQHAPAEVRPAPSPGHAHHDAPSDGGRTTYCSTEPRLLCPVLHLQPAAVHQPAAGPADDTLPVTGEGFPLCQGWIQNSSSLRKPSRVLSLEVSRTLQVTLVSWLNVSSSRQQLDEVIRRCFPSLLKCRDDDRLYLFTKHVGEHTVWGCQGVILTCSEKFIQVIGGKYSHSPVWMKCFLWTQPSPGIISS